MLNLHGHEIEFKQLHHDGFNPDSAPEFFGMYERINDTWAYIGILEADKDEYAIRCYGFTHVDMSFAKCIEWVSDRIAERDVKVARWLEARQ